MAPPSPPPDPEDTPSSPSRHQTHIPPPENSSSGYSTHPGYAQIQSRDDTENPPADVDVPSELDPLRYPPAPPGYYRRDIPTRITRWFKLFGVLVVIALACIAIAAVIDVSSPSARYEPGTDKQSVADGVLAGMDRSADPCDNFYEYACGSWLRSVSLPLDRGHYTKSFGVVYDMIELMIKEMLESSDVEASKPAGFYAACIDQMGSGGLNTLYLEPFRDIFDRLNNAESLMSALAKIHMRDTAALFEADVDLDERDPSHYILYLGQGGLGLPHRDTYFSMKDEDVDMRRRYLSLLQTLLSAAGKARLIPRQGHEILARDVLDFETHLANVTLPPEQLRDPEKAYNKINIDKLPAQYQLSAYLSSLGIDKSSLNGTLVVDNVLFFDKIGQVLTKVDSDVDIRRIVRGYLAVHLVRSAAGEGLLGESMYHENFKFKQYLYGLKQLPEKWKFCQTLTNKHLGEAVGALFVEKHFPESRKSVAVNLAREISDAFAASLKQEEWMDDQTRNLALDKLSGVNRKVGYSDKLDTYTEVLIARSFQSNVASALSHKWKRKLFRLGKPRDDSEWFMYPQEVNAYYSPTRNEIVFPAGILQQPFFSDAYPDAMNYGGIGAVIGHEMSHGFDDEGRKYDKYGRLRSWWSDASATEYESKAKCFVDLFNTYKPREVNIHVRGTLTLGENLADTNGVNVAYRAFKSRANNTEDGIPPPNTLLARELTNDQLFFVAYAQVWCTLYRHEALKVQMMTDPHSPGQFRVQGPLSQSAGFSKAFNCRNGSRYNPDDKCHLW